MDKKLLKKILTTESVEFSLEEIEQLMDEELEKPSEEIDAELVDMCLQILTKEPETEHIEKPKSKRKIVKFTKMLIAAALIAMFVVLSLPATADIYDIDVFENTVVQKIGNFFKITFREEKEVDLTKNFPGIDLSKNTLPDFIFDENCVITDLKSQVIDGDGIIKFSFQMKDSEISGYVDIFVPKKFDKNQLKEYNINSNYSKIKELHVNGVRVFVISNGEENLIRYEKNGMVFNFTIKQCSFEKAVEIANTIG